MKTHIFIKTYPKDFVWLEWCLKSIKKFCSGFTGVSIVCDISGSGDFPVDVVSGMRDVSIFWVDPPAACNGYIYQQAVKLQALDYCPQGTEVILYVDSDVVFFRDVTPENLLNSNGKIILLKEKYSKLLMDKNPAAKWQRPTEIAVGVRPYSEYMRRMPLAFHANTLRHIRARYPHWIPALLTGAWKEFSEFNAMGFVADLQQNADKASDLYDFRDVDLIAPDPPYCKQFWSWGGLQEEHLVEIKGFLECE